MLANSLRRSIKHCGTSSLVLSRHRAYALPCNSNRYFNTEDSEKGKTQAQQDRAAKIKELRRQQVEKRRHEQRQKQQDFIHASQKQGTEAKTDQGSLVRATDRTQGSPRSRSSSQQRTKDSSAGIRGAGHQKDTTQSVAGQEYTALEDAEDLTAEQKERKRKMRAQKIEELRRKRASDHGVERSEPTKKGSKGRRRVGVESKPSVETDSTGSRWYGSKDNWNMMIKAVMKRQEKANIEKRIMERTGLLSLDLRHEIYELHQQDPEEWTENALASKFFLPVSRIRAVIRMREHEIKFYKNNPDIDDSLEKLARKEFGELTLEKLRKAHQESLIDVLEPDSKDFLFISEGEPSLREQRANWEQKEVLNTRRKNEIRIADSKPKNETIIREIKGFKFVEA